MRSISFVLPFTLLVAGTLSCGGGSSPANGDAPKTPTGSDAS